MKRKLARGLRAGWPAMIALAAGCAHHGDPDTGTYVMGTIFLLIGVAAGVALILSLD